MKFLWRFVKFCFLWSLPRVSFRSSCVWFVSVPRFLFILFALLSRLPLFMWALPAIFVIALIFALL